MKARRKIKLLSLAIIIFMIVSANVSFSQDEYDDMYFNPADRKEVKFNENLVKTNAASGKSESQIIAKSSANTDVINPTYSPAEYGDLEESYSAKTVNPEYIERYKDNPKATTGTTEVAEGDSYYDDYYDRAVMPGETEKGSEKVNYPYPSSYYGGYNAAMRNRMYRNPWYDPFYGGGFAPGFSMGLGYSFGMMPGFSMSLGYGTGMGYGGYSPYGFYDPYMAHMGRYYDPFYSPWGYDPFYSPYAYNSMYRNSMMYGYGGPGFCSPFSSYGYGSGYGATYVAVPVSSGSQSSGAVAESNTLRSPSYRTRASRGSDQVAGVAQDAPNTRRTIATRSTANERVSSPNARVADRDFSRSQNEYYSRSGSRNATSTVSSSSSARNTAYTSSRNMGSSVSNTSAARVRSTRSNSTYSRPSYKSSREQRSINSGSTGRSWNSGTYRSSRSSGSSTYTPASRSGGSSSYGSSGSSFRSSSGGSRSSGSISSGGGSRSGGSSGGASRSGRGN